MVQKIKIWQLWDSNPRPQSGLVPKTSALDHSAKLPFMNIIICCKTLLVIKYITKNVL